MIIKGVSDIIRIIASPLSKESTGGKLDATSFREITDLIPFHVFFILCQLLSKYLLQEACLLFVIRVESKFLYFL